MKQIFLSLSLLALVACSPKEQQFIRDADHQPIIDSAHFIASDAVALPYRSWLPTSSRYKKNPKAVILSLHGFNDYSRAFMSVGTFMQKHNIATYAYDQRGFGSTEQIGIWAGQNNLLRDVKQAVQALKNAHPKSPIYVMGASMGAAVTLAAVTEPDFPKVDGIILSAPAVWGSHGMNYFFRGTLWLMAHVMPGKTFSGSDLKVLASNNFPMLRKMSMDPLVIKQTRVDATYGVVQMMGLAYDRVPDVAVPVMMMYGKNDQVIPASPVNEVINRFNAPITFAYYDWAYHMLLRDLQREIAFKDILYWIQHQDAKLPSGSGRKIDPAADRNAILQKQGSASH